MRVRVLQNQRDIFIFPACFKRTSQSFCGYIQNRDVGLCVAQKPDLIRPVWLIKTEIMSKIDLNVIKSPLPVESEL